MSSISWKDFLSEFVTTFREEFKKFDLKEQELIRERGFDELPLEPCQIELLDYGVRKAVVILLIHDRTLPDMIFRIHKDVKSLEVSEFTSKYGLSLLLETRAEKIEELFSMSGESTILITKGNAFFHVGERLTATELVTSLISQAKGLLRTEQVDVIKRSADGLKESISKIPEKGIRDELLATTRKIDASLQEIRRLDEDIGKVRKLVGVTKEIQDWKLLVSDIDRLKGEHVSKQVFDAKIERLDEKIEKGLESLNQRVDEGIKALNTRIEDLKAIKFWSKRTLLEIALAIWGAIVTLIVAGIIKI